MTPDHWSLHKAEEKENKAGPVSGKEWAGPGAPEAHTVCRKRLVFTHLPQAPKTPGIKIKNIVSAVF